MEISPLSDRSVAEEKEEAFVASTPRRKKRSLAARRAALRPWVIGIGLTVLVAVASVVAYRLGAGIGSWNEKPSAAATPTVHPAPAPTVSTETPMSGGYQIGPDGVLVRPAEFAADTYTKPELPEAAKENSERGAELAAEHYLAFSATRGTRVTPLSGGLVRGMSRRPMGTLMPSIRFTRTVGHTGTLHITSIVEVEPVTAEMGAPPNTIGVLFHVTTTNGTICSRTAIIVSDNEYTVSFALFMTWQENRWVVTDGNESSWQR